MPLLVFSLRILRWLMIISMVLILCFQLWCFIKIQLYRWQPPQETSVMQLRSTAARDVGKEYRLHYQWVDWENIATSLKKAVIASEDAKFMEHHGFDWQGIAVAAKKNDQRGTIVAGGSTISQQLAKNLFLSGERTYLRKLQEALLTVMLETCLSKKRIIELYLNVIEWGDGIFGAEAAAQYYYQKPASRLTEAQAAQLAAFIPNPRMAQKAQNTFSGQERAIIIRERMTAVRLPH